MNIFKVSVFFTLAISALSWASCLPTYDPAETPFNGSQTNLPQCDAPGAEVCDGLDNDCDGQIDEDFPRRGVACGNNIGACAAITVCDEGQEVCFAVQAPEDELCDGLDNDCDGIVDELTDDDPENCGECGNTCEVDNGLAGCRLGTCTVETCADGFLDCDRDQANGCETDIISDPTNCGACANICSADFSETVCSDGNCVIEECLGGRTDCNNAPVDGCESDLVNDPLNCGTCGMGCDFANALSSCQDMVCIFDACLNGFGDRDEDPNNGCEVGLRLLSSPPDSQLTNLTVTDGLLLGSAGDRIVGYQTSPDGAIGALAFTHQIGDNILQLDSDSGLVLASLAGGDIHLLDITPEAVTTAGIVTTTGPSPRFTRDGDLVYVADGRDGLRVVDISTPGESRQIGRVPTPGLVQNVFLSGDTLLLSSNGSTEFYVVDVSAPQNPQFKSTFQAQSPFDQAILSGDLLITGTTNTSRFQLYRQDEGQLTFLGQTSLPGGLISLEQRFPFVLAVVAGRHPDLGDGNRSGNTFALVDIRRPQQPTVASAFTAAVANEPRSAVFFGDQTIVAGSNGLQRFDIADLRRPDSLQDIVRPQELRDIAVDNNRLFISADGAVEILDNTDPQAPLRLARLGNDYRQILPAGNRVFVTSDGQGIVGYVLNDITDDTPPFIVIEGPSPASLEINSNGTALYTLNNLNFEVIDFGGDAIERSTIELPATSCRDMVRHQNILYIACDNGVIALDPLTPPAQPTIIAQPGGGDTYKLNLFGQTLYSVTDSAIEVYSALSPGELSFVTTVELGATGLRHIAGSGPNMVVGSGNQMRLVDRTSLTNVFPVALRTLEGNIVNTTSTTGTFYTGTNQGVFRFSVEGL